MTYPRTTTGESGADASRGVPSTPRFPDIERRVLDYWEADGTFRASVEARDPGPDGEN